MAKLIGHYYNPEKCGYIAYEIDGLKETEKQYSRLLSEGMKDKYDYWAVMPKSDLGKLRYGYNHYHMYDLKESLEVFKGFVIATLKQNADAKKKAYDEARQMLEAATKMRDVQRRD